MIVDIVYCGGGNPRFYEIATSAGFLYGARLPDTVYGPLYFADQDWKRPNKKLYMDCLAKYRPYMATVLDWEREDQLSNVLEWAEEASQYIQEIIIIPKVHNAIHKLPKFVNGKPVRLGYSTPTKYGGTEVMANEFIGWPVHLLGGSPQKQKYLTQYLNVKSVDGNMAQKMATQRCCFFDPSRSTGKGYWSSLQAFDGKEWGNNNDAVYEAFRRSCENIMAFWKQPSGAADVERDEA